MAFLLVTFHDSTYACSTTLRTTRGCEAGGSQKEVLRKCYDSGMSVDILSICESIALEFHRKVEGASTDPRGEIVDFTRICMH